MIGIAMCIHGLNLVWIVSGIQPLSLMILVWYRRRQMTSPIQLSHRTGLPRLRQEGRHEAAEKVSSKLPPPRKHDESTEEKRARKAAIKDAKVDSHCFYSEPSPCQKIHNILLKCPPSSRLVLYITCISHVAAGA